MPENGYDGQGGWEYGGTTDSGHIDASSLGDVSVQGTTDDIGDESSSSSTNDGLGGDIGDWSGLDSGHTDTSSFGIADNPTFGITAAMGFTFGLKGLPGLIANAIGIPGGSIDVGVYRSDTIPNNAGFWGVFLDSLLPDEIGVMISVGISEITDENGENKSTGIGAMAGGFVTVSAEEAKDFFEGSDVDIGFHAPVGVGFTVSLPTDASQSTPVNGTATFGVGAEAGAEVSVSYGLGFSFDKGFVARGEGGSVSFSQPVAIDLNGDGVEISFGAEVKFDLDDDGYVEQTSWVAPDDGFLVIDLQADGSRIQNADGTYGDGKIDQAREIAFALWGTDGMTDLQALAEAVDENGDKIFDLDANGDSDGVLNSDDLVWNELRIWQDANSNGKVDAGELMTLDGVDVVNISTDSNGVETSQTLTGITEINLGYDDDSTYEDDTDDITVFGNTLHGLASLTVGGTTIAGAVGDVSLSYNSLGWKVVGTQDADGEYIGDWYVEFEDGDRYDYHTLIAADGVADVDLTAAWLDGATGNDFANTLNASSSTKSVAISGRGGDDVLKGGNNDDMLSGDKGADILKGNAGNDVLFVDADDTIIKGGSGYDTVIAVDYEEVDSNGDAITPDGISLDLFDADSTVSADIEAAYGNAGDDTLDGSDAPWAVVLYGGGGADSLTGGLAGDILSGDDGVDTVAASDGDDFVTGGAGADSLTGDGGDDFIMGGAGNDSVDGGNGDDFILGGDGKDTVNAGGGDDYLAGDAGQDSLDGGDGDDRLYGGGNHDILSDGTGDDHLEGGLGDDTFVMSAVSGTSSYDVVFGGKGADTIQLKGDRADWTWTSVFYVDIQITGYGGQDGDEPIYESVDRGVQQYTLTNGKAFIEIQDIETLSFETGANETLIIVPLDETDPTWNTWNVDNSDTYYRSNTGYLANTLYTHNNWLAGNGDDTVLSVVSYEGQGQDSGITFTDHYAAGDDTFSGLAGNDALAAGTGDDLVKGGAGSDVLSGDAGNDTLRGSTGSDAIFGGDGLDTIKGASGSDRIDGGAGNDSISGGSGGDYISAGLGADNVSGGSGSDLIGGEAGNDTIMGEGGDDRLYGGDGNDIMDGGISNDSLYGGIGMDTLIGDYGNDLLVGGDGADDLFGGHGFDLMYGGKGDDLMEGGDFDDVLYGGDGADTLKGDEGADFLEGGDGADKLKGGEGLRDVASYANSDAVVTVALSLDGSTTAGTGVGGHAEGDTLFYIESLLGSRYADNLTGNGDSNTLSGGAGHDTINSGAGNDYVYGGAGADSLNGGDGIDRLYGGFEADILVGGAGDDQLFGGVEGETQTSVSLNITNGAFDAQSLAIGEVHAGAIGWTSFSGSVATINASADQFSSNAMNGADRNFVWLGEYSAMEQVISGGIDADEQFSLAVDIGKIKDYAFDSNYKLELLIGGVVLKEISGSVVNDGTFQTVYITLKGGGLEVTQFGEDITLRITSTDKTQMAVDNVRLVLDNDTLSGGDGRDGLYGGIGDDILKGDAGSDTLSGGIDNDTLTGGTGTDVFVFGTGEGQDVITDFEDGTDLIDLSSLGLTWADKASDGLWHIYASGSGSDAKIVYETGHHVILTGIDRANLTESDFIF